MEQQIALYNELRTLFIKTVNYVKSQEYVLWLQGQYAPKSKIEAIKPKIILPR